MELSPRWTVIFWFCVIVVSGAAALYFVKLYSTNRDNWQYLIYSMMLYAVCVFSLSRILILNYGVGMVNVMWNLLSTLYGLFIGLVLFSEVITNLQILGAILGVVAMILMSYESVNLY